MAMWFFQKLIRSVRIFYELMSVSFVFLRIFMEFCRKNRNYLQKLKTIYGIDTLFFIGPYFKLSEVTEKL